MELLTAMVDSGYATAKDYEQYYLKFYAEAKQELKKERAGEGQQAIAKAEKANKADEEDKNDGEEKDSRNELLQTYSVLLLPFWDKNPGVATFFDGIMQLKNKRIRFYTMLLLLRNNKPVQDSLLHFYAASDDYRIDLYRELKKVKLLNKFPAAYNNQFDLVKSDLVNAAYQKYDTLVLLEKMPVTYKNKKGIVYFFKYKNKKEEKKWKVISYGLQPENAKVFADDNDDFITTSTYSYSRNETNFLDEDKPVKEQLQKLLKMLLYKMHNSASQFYSGGTGEEDEEIITERIKTNQY